MKAKRDKYIGLPKNWPHVPKRIKKKYLDKCERWFEDMATADLPAGGWD